MFSFLFPKKKVFEEKPKISFEFPKIDMHSHILFGIDDGAKTIEDSIFLIQKLNALGYETLIATPHVMYDTYKNTPEIILEKLEQVREAVKQNNIPVEIYASAEYYLDEGLIEKLKKKEKLLSFGQKNYILFETGFMTMPNQIWSVIFELQSQGYQPIFAHPERYDYIQNDINIARKIKEKGVFLQLNANSLSGYYGKGAFLTAEKLLDENLISFLGTDCHHERHVGGLEKILSLKLPNALQKNIILNNEIAPQPPNGE
jgi:protein-tyrosine phosphatase